MLGDQLWASALASARTSTSAGVVGAPSGGVGRSAGVPRGTDPISAPGVMVLPMAGIMRSTSHKARYGMSETVLGIDINSAGCLALTGYLLDQFARFKPETFRIPVFLFGILCLDIG